MKKINMNYEELKEIFSLCKMETLDSIDILTYNVTDYDLEEFKRALTMGMQIVYGRCSDDYEGMNEYDFLVKLHNFDLTEIVDYIDPYNQNELNCFKSLIVNAIKNIKENECEELTVLPNIEETLNRINMCLGNLQTLEHELDDDELKKLFNKYSISDLESFDTIFKYVYNFDIAHIVEIRNEVLVEKQKQLLHLNCKNVDLDLKELTFLEELLAEADYNAGAKAYEGNQNVPAAEISNFHEFLLEEKDKRNVKIHLKKLGN